MAVQALAVLAGRARHVAESIAAQADACGLADDRRTGVEACVRYLTNNTEYLRYDQALASGWPIATGVIEGACRHMIGDRLAITGSRWASREPRPSSGSAPSSTTGTSRRTGHSTCAASTTASTRLATRTDTTSSPDRTGHCRRATPLSVRWMSPCLVTGRVVVPEPADLLRDAGSRHAWPACPLVAPVARRVSPAPPPWRCPIFARSCRSARRPGQRPR